MSLSLLVGTLLHVFLPVDPPAAVEPEFVVPKTVNVCVSSEELKLYNLINAYRKEKGLKPVPLSKSLTYVAKKHCRDLLNNRPDQPDKCNTHSWSKSDNWTGCCYTNDHKAANCMWDKPREMTNYPGNGYEIAFGASAPEYNKTAATAEAALAGWKSSHHHNMVIINTSIWKDVEWGAIGVGMHQGVATVWFGAETDPDGRPVKCGN